jgi:hypothetical protein
MIHGPAATDELQLHSNNKQNEEKWGQIFILDIAGWRKVSTRFLLKQTETKVKDKDLSPISIRHRSW